jgi:exosortase C (VPDSG-CTERM-specific)
MIAYTILLTLAFALPLAQLARHAASSPLHSHILLVPVIAAYLLHDRRAALPAGGGRSTSGAVVCAACGVAAVVIALAWTPPSENDYLALMALAYGTLLVAGAFWFNGAAWMRAASFPAAFLVVFLVPLPDRLVELLEHGSVIGSTEAAAMFFQLAGTPFVRQDTIFELSTITIRVAQECSGIRSSWVLLITSVLAAHMFLGTRWRRLLLVAFVIPLGLVRNGFRVYTIGQLCVSIGPHMIDSAVHHRGGPIFFVLSLGPLLLLLWWLRRGEARDASTVMPAAGVQPVSR